MIRIETTRLILREWLPADLPYFALLNASPTVMKYFPNTLSHSESDALADRLQGQITANGYGFYAAERLEDSQFIGFLGVNKSSPKLPFAPCADIGWRLDEPFWGQGYATEGAVAALADSFDRCGLENVVSMTPVLNKPSENVMKKIGMTRAPNTFEHPEVPPEHPLARHLLYTISRSTWASLPEKYKANRANDNGKD